MEELIELNTLFEIIAIVMFWAAIFIVAFFITTGCKAVRIYIWLCFIAGSGYSLLLQPDPLYIDIALFVIIFLLSSYGMGHFYGKIWDKERRKKYDI